MKDKAWLADFYKRLAEAKKRPQGLSSPPLPAQPGPPGEHPRHLAHPNDPSNISPGSQQGEDFRQALKADVAIVTALQEEKTAVLKVFGETWNDLLADGILFKTSAFLPAKNQRFAIRLAVASQTAMGMVPAAILATKVLKLCAPTYLVMTGICAGVKGEVGLGDIVIAQSVFDHGSGKLIEGKLHPDYSPIPIEPQLLELVKDCMNDQSLISTIADGWQDKNTTPKTPLRAHVGPMASGAAVIADQRTVKNIVKHVRSLKAIDMEAYAVVKTLQEVAGRTNALIVKAVTDFASVLKDDSYRYFAAYASARFVKLFFSKYYDALFGVHVTGLLKRPTR